MAVFLSKTIQQDENTISLTYLFKVPWEVGRRGGPRRLSMEELYNQGYPQALRPATSTTSFDSRIIDPNCMLS
ncbi:hypothetical protein Y032_0017g3475 [Ancylostoma ceylanicum]|uniref:Uncharacterized protein n=1 Tax=Ancylostoma ceylanicum TaxID=53326 RepID=A0A016V7F3_9BILA|nr:hypothetical protein Y032_0017g3475 [Ancylostoma ceylanicum]